MRKKKAPAYLAQLEKSNRLYEGRMLVSLDQWGCFITEHTKRSLQVMYMLLLDELRAPAPRLWCGCPEDKADHDAYFLYVYDCVHRKEVVNTWNTVPPAIQDHYRALAKA